MIMCRIVNLTSMSIVIEDIGIRLQPIRGSHATVRADMADRSSDLKKCSSWVRVERFEVVPSSVVNPNRHNVDSQHNNDTVESLKKIIDGMSARQEELFKILMSSMSSQSNGVGKHKPTEVFRNTLAGTDLSDTPRTSHDDFSDTIVVPWKIVPDSVEVSVKANETEFEVDDFDAALEALKKSKSTT